MKVLLAVFLLLGSVCGLAQGEEQESIGLGFTLTFIEGGARAHVRLGNARGPEADIALLYYAANIAREHPAQFLNLLQAKLATAMTDTVPSYVALSVLSIVLDDEGDRIRFQSGTRPREQIKDIASAVQRLLVRAQVPTLREVSASVLGKLGSPAATKYLSVALYRDQDVEVRLHAVRALAQIPDPKILRALQYARYYDADAGVRQLVAHYLHHQRGGGMYATSAGVIDGVRSWCMRVF